jgi:hypothetical protein
MNVNFLILFKEVIIAYTNNCAKHTKWLLIVKSGEEYSNHRALKD